MLIRSLLWPCAAAVYVGWPMNEQLPNVARVDQQYLFTLADSTYKSSLGGSISYEANNLPQWLLFDTLSRSFHGKPLLSDVGTFEISLAGTDSEDNSQYSANYLMIVSNSTGLHLTNDDVMFTQIAKYGQTNGVDSLVVKQGEKFSIQFSTDVFEMDNDADTSVVAYYGRSQNRTPLPNWISFDSSTYTFSGTVPYVPSSIAPSMEYSFSFIASDYAGYAGAVGTFKLAVGAHQLSTSLNESIKVNGTYSSQFDYTVPVFTDVYLDSERIAKENISSVTLQDLPSYVLFDDKDYTLTGTFPNSSIFQNFSILVLDVYGNLVSLPYTFDSIGSVFTVDKLPNLNATKGQFFLAQLMRSYFTDFNDTTIDVSTPSWITYHESNLTLNGNTPKDFSLEKITVKASSDFDEEERSFTLTGYSKAQASASAGSSSSASPTSSTSSLESSAAGSASQSKKSGSNKKKLILGLAIGLPVFAILLAAILLFCCCCRRRKSHSDTESETHSGQSKSATEELTGPGFGTINNEDDHTETAHRLSKINALKLDNDNKSTLSTLTHVESRSDMEFFDASEKPMLSWRANDTSDSNAMKKLLLQKHASDLSMETVNTENLFSVRLVDDNASPRNSDHNSTTNLLGTMDPGLVSMLLNNNSSTNFQRLDSDGNIVEDTLTVSSPVQKLLRHESTASLNNILEEEDSNNTFYTQESSNYNLMDKFLKGGSINSSSSAKVDNSLHEEFEPRRGPDGEIVLWDPKTEPFNMPSHDVASFLLDSELTPRNNARLAERNQSRTSVYSELSFSSQVGSTAKLVNFTRKASMRDSSRQQDVEHPAASATILDDSESG